MYANPFLEFCSRFYAWFIWVGEHLQSLFLLILRLTWGQQFFLTGLGRYADGHFFLATIETICGGFLFIGFASRLAALPLICTTFSFLVTHHVFDGFDFISNPSLLVHSSPFPYLMTALIIFVFGPGRISLDGWIKRNSRHWHQL
jgi:putative oxidoreductase